MNYSNDFLNPLLNCFAKFKLSLADKVTIGACNLASIILNFAESPSLDQMQSSVQFNSDQHCQLELHLF